MTGEEIHLQYLLKKNPCIGGPTQFKLMLFKGQWQLNCQKLRQGNSIKNRKKKTSVQGNPHKTIIRIFSRKIAGQKKVAQYVQGDERKTNPPAKSPPPSKAVLQKGRRERVL